MNQLQCMRVFVEVVEKSSFGHAAHALRMATASVSIQVKNLEAHLGARLLHRTTRSISLTDEGARYYRHCKQVLEEMSNVEASLSGSKSAPRGRLRVDADESYVSNLLVPVLPEFFDRYPQIHIDFVHTGHFFDINDTGADVMLRMFTCVARGHGSDRPMHRQHADGLRSLAGISRRARDAAYTSRSRPASLSHVHG